MADPVPFEWKGWLGWVAATMVGAELVVLIVYFWFPNIPSAPFKGSPFQQLVGLVLIGMPGTVVAAVQWIWLRRRMSKAGWWIAAAVVGWYVILGLSTLRNLPAVERFTAKFETATDIISFCLLGAVMSLPQWLLLRRKFLGAGYWIIARPLGWLAGYGLFLLAAALHVIQFGLFGPDQVFGWYAPDLVNFSVIGELFGFGLGAVTGAAVVWILRKPKSVLTGESS